MGSVLCRVFLASSDWVNYSLNYDAASQMSMSKWQLTTQKPFGSGASSKTSKDRPAI